MASGRKRIIVGDITQSNVRGKALADALDKGLNQDEKSSSYEKESVKKNENKKKFMAL